MFDQHELQPGEVLKILNSWTLDVVRSFENTTDKPILIAAVPSIRGDLFIHAHRIASEQSIPIIHDDDDGTVAIKRAGVILKSWIYRDDNERKAKMARAWEWMDGYRAHDNNPVTELIATETPD
ncbi:hypothetical protein [Roseibium sp. Sym1]|uniref:hypothetical protein n=1 Tax=Roseibium sp. Sym1 TaxID=3016006 RepID=UPI0022B5BDEE|nr:hypothetical protein [Roseibium sp. Sym1]